MKKVIAILLTVFLILPQVFVFTANAEEETTSYEDLFASPYDDWISEHSKINEKQPEVTEEIKSKDGKYGYVLNKETGEAYFSHAFEKNLKVLNIPEQIDGHKIVGTMYGRSESPYLFQVNYSKYIKDIYHGGLDFSVVPCCKINLNEGLETVHQSAFKGIEKDSTGFYAEDGADEYLDEIIFPSTLKEIKPKALDPNIKRIVFQSDPVVDLGSDARDKDINTVSKYNVNCELEIYYTGNALNATDKSFAQWYTHVEMVASFYYPWKIYHKPRAKGFEKLAEAGCKVEEYTEEFWKNPTKKGNQATKIVIDDMTIKVPMKKNIWVEPKIYPQNADTPRIWYYPQHNDFFPDVYINIDGLMHRTGQSDTRNAGTTTKVIAVADCGMVTDFTVTLTDKDVPTTKKSTASGTTTTKYKGAFSEQSTKDSSTTQNETKQGVITTMTDKVKQTVTKIFDKNNTKSNTGAKIAVIGGVSLATLGILGTVAYIIIKKKK